MKTVDRHDPSQATTAYPRVRSSQNARVMTNRVNGCLAAVFDRAWIILTTGARGFMKVPRWLYCTSSRHPYPENEYYSFACRLVKFIISLSGSVIRVTDDTCGLKDGKKEGLSGRDVYIVFNYWDLITHKSGCSITVSWILFDSPAVCSCVANRRK